MRRPLFVAAVVAGPLAFFLLGCGSTYEQAKVRGSNIKSMTALRDVSIALEHYRHDHGSYPAAGSMAELQKLMAPMLDHAQISDRWGEPLIVDVSAESYVLTSKGDDRIGGPEFGGAVTTPGHSITLKDAVFVQYDSSVEETARAYETEIAAIRNQGRGGV